MLIRYSPGILSSSSKDPAGCEGSDYSPTQREGWREGGMMEGIIQGVGGFVGGVQETNMNLHVEDNSNLSRNDNIETM